MPAVIGSQTEVKPANLTHCRWLVRKLIIHSIEYVETPKSRSFSKSTLYPMWSKALEKSRKQRQRCLPHELRYVSQVWIMSSKQYIVEVPFRHPNCSGSILSLTSSINHLTTKSSRTLDRQKVHKVGLKSLSSIGGCIFGMGIILDSFQTTSTIPDRSDVLKMVVIGSGSWYVNSLTMWHGTLSGPWAMEGLMAGSFLQTSWGYTDRTPASAGRKAGGILLFSGGVSALTET